MAKYYPEPPPDTVDFKELLEWTWRELNRISQLAAIEPAFNSIITHVLTSSGTFVPDVDSVFWEVSGWGGGGAGGGAVATAAGQVSVGNGGQGGAKAIVFLTPDLMGPSQAYVIGAGGTAASGANGGNGSATTFGSLLSAAGGIGGVVSAAGTNITGSFQNAVQSTIGDYLGWTFTSVPCGAANGGQTIRSISGMNEWGGGETSPIAGNGNDGAANTGAGGSGTINGASDPARTGGNGGSGLIIVKEYLSR